MNIVVLISGNGSNLQAIINAITNKIPLKIAAVISNEPDAYGLERARKANIPAHIVPHREFSSRTAFENALQTQIDVYNPDLIVLAGFMRKLGKEFVKHYAYKIINIHPSLLPKYPGLNTHNKVIVHGDKEHGVSIHYVTDLLDGGPLIAQAKLQVHDNDTADSLKSRIQAIEHKLYPEILKRFAQGRIEFQNGKVLMDGTAQETVEILYSS